MYHSILVPTDGSETAIAAAREAASLAEAVGVARIHVVYVIDEGAVSLLFSDQRLSDLLELLTEEGGAATNTTADAIEAGGVEVVTDVIRGMRVNEALIEYAHEHGVDLVVMGTNGRHGIEYLLGSTTERLLAKSDLPVLVISRAYREKSGE
jgi:nucleotide-binding universal stress UspA family protein